MAKTRGRWLFEDQEREGTASSGTVFGPMTGSSWTRLCRISTRNGKQRGEPRQGCCRQRVDDAVQVPAALLRRTDRLITVRERKPGARGAEPATRVGHWNTVTAAADVRRTLCTPACGRGCLTCCWGGGQSFWRPGSS